MLFQIVFDGEANPIDADLHERFWSQFSERDRRAWIAAEGTDQSPAARILFFERQETAFRQSLYETVVSGATTRTPELDALRAQAPGSRADPDDLWTQQIGRQDRLLDPMRLRASKYTSRYPIVAFDQWNDARLALRQVDLLLRSKWSEPQVLSWPYPELRLTLDWTYPLEMRSAAMCEFPCNVRSMLHVFDDQRVAMVFYFRHVSRASDLLEYPEARVGINLMTDLPWPYKVLEQWREDDAWQGYQSSIFRSSVELKDQLSYHIVRILFREQFEDGLLLVGVSSRSMAEAESAFDQIDQAIRSY